MMRVTRGESVTGLEGDAGHGAQSGDSERKQRRAPRAARPKHTSTRALLPALATVMTRNTFQRGGDELADCKQSRGRTRAVTAAAAQPADMDTFARTPPPH